MNNGLTVSRLNEALHLGRLGVQVALRTERAFSHLRFVRADEVPWDEYHARYVRRDAAAREEWRQKLRDAEPEAKGVFAYDVIRMGLRQDDERIREILPA